MGRLRVCITRVTLRSFGRGLLVMMIVPRICGGFVGRVGLCVRDAGRRVRGVLMTGTTGVGAADGEYQ
jgi:hypothetical protein